MLRAACSLFTCFEGKDHAAKRRGVRSTAFAVRGQSILRRVLGLGRLLLVHMVPQPTRSGTHVTRSRQTVGLDFRRNRWFADVSRIPIGPHYLTSRLERYLCVRTVREGSVQPSREHSEKSSQRERKRRTFGSIII